MRVELFDYSLPKELIAQHPAEPRDSSRLLVLNRATGERDHRVFSDLPSLLSPGDALVVNRTRVIPARLMGRREKTRGHWEGLFLLEEHGVWELMTQTRGKPQAGELISIDGADWKLALLEKTDRGTWLAKPITDTPRSAVELLEGVGHVPIPPYIRQGADSAADRADYQTVFADRPGAVAAPTAGLHFTPMLIEQLERQGVLIKHVALHVGPGTFLPVTAEDTSDHRMHEEWCEVEPAVASELLDIRSRGGRIVAVGTTVVRTLESAADAIARGEGFSGPTSLFIAPPYTFRFVDALITNFHLPRSTLLMLVSAFAGRERTLDAYRVAAEHRYRFYSYGDAMLIV